VDLAGCAVDGLADRRRLRRRAPRRARGRRRRRSPRGSPSPGGRPEAARMTGTDTNGVLYELKDASRTFRRGSSAIAAVDSIDLTIPVGGFMALVGPSGSGKTTPLQLLGALDRVSSGHVFFDGRDLGSLPDGELADLRLHAFGFVFQQFNLIPTLTAL